MWKNNKESGTPPYIQEASKLINKREITYAEWVEVLEDWRQDSNRLDNRGEIVYVEVWNKFLEKAVKSAEQLCSSAIRQ